VADDRAKKREAERRRYWADPERFRAKRRRNRNPKRESEAARRWQTEHPGYAAEWVRRDRLVNPEKYAERERLRGPRNSEQDRAYQRTYREAHKAEIAAKTAAWRLAHPERNLELKEQASRRRRARLTGVPHEEFTRDEIFERDGWVCGICGEPVDPTLPWPHPRFKSLDHIIPIAKGGANTRANVQCAHTLCNARKSAR